jgi:hypothetical protein
MPGRRGRQPVIGNDPCCQPIVPGAPALAVGDVTIGGATHEVASGSKPYQVAENQTNQHVPDFESAASVTLPNPSAPAAPAAPVAATAPLTVEGESDGPACTPYCARSDADNPPLLMAPSRTFCMAFDSADCTCTSYAWATVVCNALDAAPVVASPPNALSAPTLNNATMSSDRTMLTMPNPASLLDDCGVRQLPPTVVVSASRGLEV